MVFCCFEQSYEEEVVSKYPDGQGETKDVQKNLIDNTDNRKKVSGMCQPCVCVERNSSIAFYIFQRRLHAEHIPL